MNRGRGFTLLELVVAVAIFALAMALAYGGLNGMLRARDQLDAEAERLRRLQLAVTLLERDVRGALVRPVRDGHGADLPALRVDRQGLELTRAGYANALASPRAELERVAWRVEQGKLERWRFPVLDRTPGTQPQRQQLLEGISDLRVEALHEDGRWLSEWGPPRTRVDALPRAIRLRFEAAGYGRIERWLELPEQRP